MKKLSIVISILLFAAVAISCGGDAERAASAKATEAAAAKEIAAAKATEAAALQVIATASATPRPTLAPTSTPTPEPTPTPARGIVAVATMSDGTVFEVDHVETHKPYHHTSGLYQYRGDYTERYLPLVVGPVALEIPLDQVERVVLKPEEVSVTLIDGQQLQGELGEFYQGYVNRARAVIGRATIAGFPAEYESEISQVDRIAFARDNAGEVSATVSTKDGTVTEDISQLRFDFDGGTTLRGVKSYSYVPLQVGPTTLEVTLADIETIQREEDRVLVLLKSGEKLDGSIPSDFSLVGRTNMFGVPAAFRGFFWDIQSVAFQ